MHTAKLETNRMNLEKMMITLGIGIMEGFGLLTLICGILGVQIF